MMKLLAIKYLLVIIPLLLVGNRQVAVEAYDVGENLTANFDTLNPCPAQTESNKSTIHTFITDPDWQKGRKHTNTDQLTESQITLLKSPAYKSVCKKLNESFHEAREKKWPDGMPMNDVTYYKVGNFYFVVISPHQPKPKDEIVLADTEIYIFNSKLKYIGGYFF